MCGCATYQFGNRSLYRADIGSIYVPIIESDIFRRHVGEQLSEAIIKEIELKTPYKVVSSPNAESVLAGRVLRDSKYVVAENANDEPRDIEIEYKVEINWRDRRGNLIAPPYIFGVPTGIVTLGQAVHLVPEAGQSVATAQQDVIQRLAEQIVARMETPW